MAPGKATAISAQGGFSYVIMLFALAMFGVGLAVIGQSWSMDSHRMKEAELIQIGNELVWAIGDYYQHPPGTVKTYPKSLDDLIEDKRFVGTHRHLRKIYSDPFTLLPKWGLIPSADGGIAGIFSLSTQPTLQQKGVILDDSSVVSGSRYTDWKFIYINKL